MTNRSRIRLYACVHDFWYYHFFNTQSHQNLFIIENDNTICVLSIDTAKNLNLNEEYNGLHLR